ncbi:glycosyltransferase family 4 protein [Isoptericola sp. NEAU-Y5]|uniref:Glycosyltransferase family 4 protein n=1 Tax=Isoptericola luteus TaxID=2879484 RepID=A0ABS7ZCW2_9MICO|nr:glycosyltransferase family 1 protein [Isoptericola sp. NEAU-Y5]MCA5892877.1 glycosyltransferase family 4 protein [Isoptericola sp. NEAU-Y5]
MARLTLATVAVGTPMGQQVYEREVAARAAGALGGDVEVTRSVTRSLRSPLPGTARLPHRLLHDAPTGLRRVVGAAMYRGADVVHRMGLSLPPARVPEIVTVHDTVAWRFPDESRPETFAAAELRRARAVVSVSQFAADDVAERLGLEHVHVIHNGVDERLLGARPATAERLRELGVEGPYVLHAGGSSTRKNLEALAAAWPKVRSRFPDVSLVLAGPPSPRRDRLFGPLDGAVRVGRVPDEDVAGLLAAASAVVVPSVYEGFGLPALEGLAVGTPVVAAARSSLPEVCGDAAVLVEPDGPSIAEGLEHVLTGGAEVDLLVARGRERAARFTWDATAAAHARLWRAVLDGRQ